MFCAMLTALIAGGSCSVQFFLSRHIGRMRRHVMPNCNFFTVVT